MSYVNETCDFGSPDSLFWSNAKGFQILKSHVLLCLSSAFSRPSLLLEIPG